MNYDEREMAEILNQILETARKRGEIRAEIKNALLEDDTSRLKYYVRKYVGLPDDEGNRVS
jgi:hypothetical protein